MDTKLTYSLNGKMVAEMSTQDDWLDQELDFENIVNEFQQHVGKQCKITGRNIGWRRTSVQHEFTMTEATTFLYMLLPNSEYNLKIYRSLFLLTQELQSIEWMSTHMTILLLQINILLI